MIKLFLYLENVVREGERFREFFLIFTPDHGNVFQASSRPPRRVKIKEI